MAEETNPRTLSTVETTCSVLRALKNLDGATVTELADHLDLSKGAAYNHLATLRQQQFVSKNGDIYQLSYQIFTFGEYVRHLSPLYNVALNEIHQLAEETGESVNLMVESFGKGIYLYKEKGETGIADEYHTNRLTNADYLHWSSTGKAILADLPDERVEEIVDRYGLPEKTENTITTEAELWKEINVIRERGYAVNDEEEIKGVRAVGASIRDKTDDVLGSVSISSPVSRMTDQELKHNIPELVKQTANIIEVTIQTQKSSEPQQMKFDNAG